MDIQPRQRTATGESRDPDYGISHQNYAEGDSCIGPDQRDMWRMGKAQELRVKPRWTNILLNTRLTTSSDTSVRGQRSVFHQF